MTYDARAKKKRIQSEKMRGKAKFVIRFVILMLIATLSLLMFSKMEACLTSTILDGASSPVYAPIMSVPAGVDKNHNGVENSLNQEIADRLANGTAQEYVNITVMLKSEPTPHDLNLFVSSGGYLIASPWTYAIYGFGGRIPYDDIDVFAKNCPDVLLIEKEAVCQESIAYAAEQVGARTYVWSTVGLQGDPNSSIAILDTGTDGSQIDFSPGYGNQNFSDKIVGWVDEVGKTTSPVDDNGHGSDVSGLAAGDGFFSTDASGNAIATWGANLGSVSSTGSYLVTGMMVNKTGTINLEVKWASTGTATLRALQLYYGEKNLSSGSWTLVNFTLTLLQNTWWPVTYNVSSPPSGGYDMYHVELAEGQGTGNLYVVITISWPYTPPSDGFSAWTGIAPQAKLVGVKVLNSTGSGTSTELINGINWIIANRQTYHITVASMSLGFSSEVSAVDDAVVNLVNSGVCTVVAAGNNGAGGNYIFTPGSVDEAITVAAMNQFDDVASYSSQGGPSMSTGNTTKPDITAPGGSFYGVPLFSAASNDNDAEGGFGDIQANNSAPMQGTSMATSIVAGAVDIVEQAMGGYSVWNWTRSQALSPKMILLMTATQTYPNLREGDTTGAYSPTLDPGGTDAQEGYGRLNLDAAVDAVLKTYQVGTTVSGSLGMPPTPSNISVLGESLAWARNVQLISGLTYNFTLSVPSGANYDLFLYNSTGTYYGDPAIVANSTTPVNGGTETFNVTAPYTGTYYLVVKRATETTGSGTFNLTSSGPVYVTFSQTGVNSDFTGTVVTIDGVNYGYSSLPQSFWWNNGSSHSFAYSSQLLVSSNEKQYVLTGVNETSPLTVSNNEIVTGTYKTQYYVIFTQTGISSDFTSAVMNIDGSNYTVGTLPVSFWYDSGSSHTFVYQSPLVATTGQKQYVWTSTSGLSSLQSGSITVSGSGSVTGTYKTQYYVTFTQTGVSSDFAGAVVTINGTGYGLTGYSGWADSGS
ncbi:MAG TPA: S8 family serine peptidase, partial [Candidatus Acidoferrales bacterium]|nr:S8 family serine peptidase [Candidatus Acidoferrales bacterium]